MAYLDTKRFKSTAGLTASGIALAVVGATGVISMIISMLSVALLAAPIGIIGTSISLVILAVLCGLSGWALFAGVRRLIVADKVKAFRRTFGNREVCTFRELSAQLQVSENDVKKAARKALSYGLIPQGCIDDEETCLMVTEDSYRMYRQAKANYLNQQKLKQTKEAAKLRAKGEPEELTPEASAFIEQGKMYLQRLRDMDVAIDDTEISKKIVAIETILGRIIARVQDAPSCVSMMDKLMDYYLPTTIKLLAAYDELESQPVQGENIAKPRKEIEQTLDVLYTAYEKLLDATFQDMSMDVSADITVLNAVLAREGLTETPFDMDVDEEQGKE